MLFEANECERIANILANQTRNQTTVSLFRDIFAFNRISLYTARRKACARIKTMSQADRVDMSRVSFEDCPQLVSVTTGASSLSECDMIGVREAIYDINVVPHKVIHTSTRTIVQYRDTTRRKSFVIFGSRNSDYFAPRESFRTLRTAKNKIDLLPTYEFYWYNGTYRVKSTYNSTVSNADRGDCIIEFEDDEYSSSTYTSGIHTSDPPECSNLPTKISFRDVSYANLIVDRSNSRAKTAEDEYRVLAKTIDEAVLRRFLPTRYHVIKFLLDRTYGSTIKQFVNYMHASPRVPVSKCGLNASALEYLAELSKFQIEVISDATAAAATTKRSNRFAIAKSVVHELYPYLGYVQSVCDKLQNSRLRGDHMSTILWNRIYLDAIGLSPPEFPHLNEVGCNAITLVARQMMRTYSERSEYVVRRDHRLSTPTYESILAEWGNQDVITRQRALDIIFPDLRGGGSDLYSRAILFARLRSFAPPNIKRYMINENEFYSWTELRPFVRDFESLEAAIESNVAAVDGDGNSDNSDNSLRERIAATLADLEPSFAAGLAYALADKLKMQPANILHAARLDVGPAFVVFTNNDHLEYKYSVTEYGNIDANIIPNSTPSSSSPPIGAITAAITASRLETQYSDETVRRYMTWSTAFHPSSLKTFFTNFRFSEQATTTPTLADRLAAAYACTYASEGWEVPDLPTSFWDRFEHVPPVTDVENSCDLACVVCLAVRKKCIFKKCAHVSVCEGCALRLLACPLCKTKGIAEPIFL